MLTHAHVHTHTHTYKHIVLQYKLTHVGVDELRQLSQLVLRENCQLSIVNHSFRL